MLNDREQVKLNDLVVAPDRSRLIPIPDNVIQQATANDTPLVYKEGISVMIFRLVEASQ